MYKRRSCVDLDITCHKQPGYVAREWSCDRHFHFHDLNDGDLLPCLDVLAGSRVNRDHDSRSRSSDDSSFYERHTMRDALDLHEVVCPIYD